MRSYLSILIVLLLPLSAVFSQTLEEREKEMAADNNIKTKIQYDYKYLKGKPAATAVKSSSTTYSRSGDILEKNYFNNKNTVIGWEKYEYDANGNRTLYERENASSKYKKTSKYSDNDDLLLETGFNGAENFRNEYTYLAPKKPSEIVYSVANRIEQKLKYEHSGNTAILGIYAGGTSLTSKVKLKYDNKRNILEEITLSTDGRELEKKSYVYNASSLLVKEEKDRQGTFIYRISYEYNDDGKLIKVMEEKPSQEKYEKKVFTYDASGNLKEFKWRRSSDEDFNIKTYTYDSRGICLTEHTYYPKTKYESLSKFEYTFY